MKYRANFKGKKYFLTVKNNIEQYGFVKSGDFYMYKKVIHKYNKAPVLELVITLIDNQARIDVVSSNTREPYHPFYNREFGNYGLLMKKIDRKIRETMKGLGFKNESGKVQSKSKKIK